MVNRIAWKLYDPVADELYVFPVNPYQDSSSYAVEKPVGYESQAYYNGKTVVFENQKTVKRFNYIGNVYTETDYNALDTWGRKENRLVLQDDLGIRYYIYFESIEFERVRSKSFPWKHRYTMTGVVLVGTPDPIV